MTLQPGDTFPNITLPDHTGKPRELARYTAYGEIDERLGFIDGYPLIVTFYRGFFCPRDQQQMRMLVQFQDELRVNYCKLVVIGVQPPIVHAAYRAGIGASFAFLADEDRTVLNELGLVDETEGEYANTARPYTFVLRPNLTIHSAYDGWFFVGRPTPEDLRKDLRAIMSGLSYYPYEVWNTDEVKRVRIPASEWADGAPPPAETLGTVHDFDFRTGNGHILADDGRRVFFNFTAIPGEGYRTLSPGTRVSFEVVTSTTGLSARNVQRA